MLLMPYSMDLRVRVINACESGMKLIKVAETFNVGRSTIRNLRKIKKERGSLEPIINYQKGHSHGITDYNAFRAYVDSNPDKSQEEIGEYFGVGSSTIGRTMQKINYSRKKRVKPTVNEMINSELLILMK